MADYDGWEVENVFSSPRRGRIAYSESVLHSTSALRLSTAVVYSGTYSRELMGGDSHSLFFGVDSGSRKFSAQAFPNSNGKVGVEILDPDTAESLGVAFSVGSGAWEKVEVSFTAERKVYVAKITNFAKVSGASGGDARAYVDEIKAE